MTIINSHPLLSPFSKMHRSLNNGGAVESRLRRGHYLHSHNDNELNLSNFLDDACPSSPSLPGSSSSLRRRIALSLMRHHRAIERNSQALPPISPASYGSSMEIAPYNPVITPASSLEIKGRVGESHYSLKTSTELLKVLNRIWSLEEQHECNISLIRALKSEVEDSNMKIKELLRERQSDRHEIDALMKQFAEEKQVRKNKEQDRLQAAVKSLREEIEDERKLRKRSESLHRKLARELSEAKSSLSIALKEAEKERRSKTLLESLCDEFAKGIKRYEKEVHDLKQKSDKNSVGRVEVDHLILDISESWLDERLQTGQEESKCSSLEKSVVEKLRPEIESFILAKWSDKTRISSLESEPLNEAAIAPQDDRNEDADSSSSDSHCFELHKPENDKFHSHRDETIKSQVDDAVKFHDLKRNHPSHERKRSDTPFFQAKVEEQSAQLSSGKKKSMAGKVEKVKAEEGKANGDYNKLGSKPSHVIADGSERRNQASPVQRRSVTPPDPPASDPSSKFSTGLIENSLKSMPQEVRSKGHRSRLRFFMGSG